METRFSAMEAATDAHVGCARAVVKAVVALSMPFVLSPREIATEAASSVAAVFTSCFSRLHARPEFNSEQQQALLSPEDEAVEARMVSEAAMRELRRRVMEGSISAVKMSRWGPASAELRQQRHSRQSIMQERTCTQVNPVPTTYTKAGPAAEPQAFTTLLSDTEQALERILGPVKATAASKKLVDADAVRCLSVDELLAPNTAQEASSSSPEKTGGESVLLQLQDEADSDAKSQVREWLEGIDASRAEEYCGYARQLEQHGFMTLADLAQLEGDDVEQAMSEAGIAKFAHRLRIRKAIQQLHASGGGASVAVAASA